jgi:ADP-ribosyl-[dinitrogen reductase] hydrolase
MIQSRIIPSPADLLPGVIDAVKAAGALIRAEFHRDGGPRGKHDKAPVDAEVEAMLKKRLQSLHLCGWHGEETTRDPIGTGDVWVVDPLDGTSDFLKGQRGAAISIALLRDARPVLGTVFSPVAPDDRGDLIAWAEGASLTRNGVSVGSSQCGFPMVIALNADAADYAAQNHDALSGLRVRALPSPAYRLALAAVGEVDAGVSLMGGLAPWDIAGAHALILGAGKKITDLVGTGIDYAKARFDGIVGGHPDAVRCVLAAPLKKGAKDLRHPARSARPVLNAGMLSRAQGAFLGQLAGDALGSTVEFQTETSIEKSYPKGVTRLADGGTWNTMAGQPTDDSEMSLALARSLCAGKGFDAALVGTAYVAWRASGPFDIGGTTAAGIAAIAAGRAPVADSQSNGALMRVSPIGIFAAGDPALAAALADADAALTHPHSVCRAASAAFAAAISAAVASATAEEIWATAHARAGDGAGAEAVRARLVTARTTPPHDYQHQMGWVLTAFQNAFYWLMNGAPLASAVIATVAKGGDTDTNAAVCGALLGAVQGRDAVPLQWRNAVLTCRPLRRPGIRHPRPMAYWPDDALDLAEALLAARGSLRA